MEPTSFLLDAQIAVCHAALEDDSFRPLGAVLAVGSFARIAITGESRHDHESRSALRIAASLGARELAGGFANLLGMLREKTWYFFTSFFCDSLKWQYLSFNLAN